MRRFLSFVSLLVVLLLMLLLLLLFVGFGFVPFCCLGGWGGGVLLFPFRLIAVFVDNKIYTLNVGFIHFQVGKNLSFQSKQCRLCFKVDRYNTGDAIFVFLRFNCRFLIGYNDSGLSPPHL